MRIESKGEVCCAYIQVELASSVESNAEGTVGHDHEEARLLDGETGVGLGQDDCFLVEEDLEKKLPQADVLEAKNILL